MRGLFNFVCLFLCISGFLFAGEYHVCLASFSSRELALSCQSELLDYGVYSAVTESNAGRSLFRVVTEESFSDLRSAKLAAKEFSDSPFWYEMELTGYPWIYNGAIKKVVENKRLFPKNKPIQNYEGIKKPSPEKPFSVIVAFSDDFEEIQQLQSMARENGLNAFFLPTYVRPTYALHVGNFETYERAKQYMKELLYQRMSFLDPVDFEVSRYDFPINVPQPHFKPIEMNANNIDYGKNAENDAGNGANEMPEGFLTVDEWRDAVNERNEKNASPATDKKQSSENATNKDFVSYRSMNNNAKNPQKIASMDDFSSLTNNYQKSDKRQNQLEMFYSPVPDFF